MTNRTMRTEPQEVRQAFAELGMEDGRDVYAPDEKQFVIAGVSYRLIETKPYEAE